MSSDAIAPEQKWLEVAATGPEDRADAVRALLSTPPFVEAVVEQDLRPGAAAEVTLRSWVPEGVAGFEAARQLQGALAGRADWRVEVKGLEERDWLEGWKAFFHPVEAAPGLTVAPPWEPVREGPGEIVIEIDPGLAFGTGGHPTTVLCMRALQRLLRAKPGLGILDVGCGSGILSIAAVRLGAARPALGVDIDPHSVTATYENAERNGLAGAIEASDTPVGDLAGTYPLVVANIISGVLVALARDIAARVPPGGWLLLSGILEHEGQPEEVLAAYAEHGLRLASDVPGGPREDFESTDEYGRWISLVLTR